MDSITYRQEVQGIAKAGHKILSLDIKNLRRMFIDDHPSHAAPRYAVLQILLSLKMEKNFENEENRVFPLLVANSHSNKATKLIIELVQEHEQLLFKAQDLNSLFVHGDINECRGELWKEMLDFLDHMQKHVTKEEKLFELLPLEAPSAMPSRAEYSPV